MAATKPSPKHTTPANDSLAYALLQTAEVVAAVMGGRTLDAALAACWQRVKPLPAIRGAIQDMAYGTLRAGPRGDFFLSKLLRSPLAEPLLHEILLVAIHRLETRPEDAHTTVNQAVEAAATLAFGNFRALANGVLRNFQRQQVTLTAEAAALPSAHLRHPDWWISAVRKAYPETWESILAAANLHPPMTLRVNQRHGTATDYVARLAQAGLAGEALDDTAVLLTKPQVVDALPGFADGHVSVQDWGAQRAAALLDVQDGMRVLDACAAPGGKAAHILERNSVALTALELDAKRTVRIHENFQRLHLTASVKTADCVKLDDWWDGKPFDRILADVPCSASGVVRRHPDIKWLRRAKDIGSFATTQQQILDALWQTLAPGGTMLYCTCSIFPQENGQQVAAFAARHPDALRLTIDNKPELQLIPTPTQDGFYYALLQKRL